MKQAHVVINGEILSADKASLFVSDLAIQRGYGIFDFFKTINGKPLFLDDHLNRFYNSANEMQLAVGYTLVELKALLLSFILADDIPYSGIKITLTGGYAADGYTIGKPNLIITRQPLVLQLPGPQGFKLVSYQHQRQMPHVKTIDYLMAIWLQPYIKQQSAHDVLYHNQGIISECPRANIFIVNHDGSIATPAHHMLKGIIRTRVLRHFSVEFNIEERNITLDEVYAAKEVFVTNSTRNIFPISHVDGKVIGRGTPGDITMDLSKKLQALIEKECG